MSNNKDNKQPGATEGLTKEGLDGLVKELEVCATRGENRGNQRPPSICKVSRILRDHSESSYKPLLVSIGPIHRKNKKLQEFEWLKECYLNDLLNRCDSPKKTLEACLLKVNTLIPKIRESYAGVIKNYSDYKLARMMVMDGCFILEFCFKHDKKNSLPNKMQNTGIAMDLMLLENQVPFFVLEALFECSMGKQSFTLSDILDKHLAPYSKLFASLKPEKKSPTDVVSDSTPADHVLGYLHKRYHLVAVDEEQAAKSSNPIHAGILWCSVNFCKKPQFLLNAPGPKQLCSSFCKIFRKCTWSNCVLAPSLHSKGSMPVDEKLAAESSNPTGAVEDEEGMEDTAFHAVEDEEGMEDTAFHSIVELDRSGMNFKPHQEDEWSMTIKFKSSHAACLPGVWKPTLLMPTLVIDDTTDLILRNFIAYEQSFPKDCYYFTSYAHAMDKLIDTQEDIARLVKSKVLVNHLGSTQEAADMINKICKNMFITDFCYTEVFKQMDEYYNRFWPKNIARLKRLYFSNPWSIIALLAAIIVSLATVVATIFAVLDYYR